jgi:hypothetical protein
MSSRAFLRSAPVGSTSATLFAVRFARASLSPLSDIARYFGDHSAALARSVLRTSGGSFASASPFTIMTWCPMVRLSM